MISFLTTSTPRETGTYRLCTLFLGVTSSCMPFREVLMQKAKHSEESITMLHRSVLAIDTLIVNGVLGMF